MHRGQNSSRIIYEKIGSQLTIIAQEQDFEVMIISYHENMLLVDHVVNTSPPPPMLGTIKKGIENKGT